MNNDKILNELRVLNLTKEQLVGHELFLKFIEENNLFKQDTQDSDALDDNFKPDEAIKYTFRNVGEKYLIPAINELCGTNFNLNSTIEFLSTEHVGTTGDVTKRSVRGDFAVRIIPPKYTQGDEVSDIVVIEFQSSEDADMPLRVNVYGINNTQKVKLYVKTPKGKEIKEVNVSPFEVVIYTTLSKRGAKGIMEYDMSYPKFKFNGVPSSAEAGDVVTKEIHYINLLKMSVDDLDKSALKFIQGIYLYKFKKNIDLIKKEDFFAIIEKIEKNLEELDGKAHDVAIKIYTNLIEDLYNIMSKDKIYYQKEIDFMEYGKNTYADKLIEKGITQGIEKGITQGIEKGRAEGITQGIEKGITQGIEKGITQGIEKGRAEGITQGIEKGQYLERTNVILSMLKKVNSTQEIHELTGYPISQIQEVRTQHSL